MNPELTNYERLLNNDNTTRLSLEEQLQTEQSPNIDGLSKALAKAQSELTSVIASHIGQSGHQKYKYAKYHDVVELVTLVLPKHGLSFSHQTVYSPRILVICKLMYENQWLRSVLPVDLFLIHPKYFERDAHKTNIMQDLGSSISYGKRYTLTSIVGIAVTEEDDDAQSLGIENSKNTSSTPKRVLFNLCKNNNIEPKDFAVFAKINENPQSVTNAIQDFHSLKDAFFASKERV